MVEIVSVLIVIFICIYFYIERINKRKKEFIENTNVSYYILDKIISKLGHKNITNIVIEKEFISIYSKNVDIDKVKQYLKIFSSKSNVNKLDLFVFDSINYEYNEKYIDITYLFK